MATSVQTPMPSQLCQPASNQITVPPNPNLPSTSLIPSPLSGLSGGDVVNIIIAISVLVGVILDKPTKSD